ncbi:MAG: SsrA-binding protein SmpB [Proteobacteria bacterium]|nr:SsrA-binding protein SmpB [Pseudomonadota bacterium]
MEEKIIANNKKARFDYIIEEEVEAGIILLGSEVKSIRAGKVNIKDSYADQKNGGLYLLNANINKYEGANQFNHEPTRPRQLLLHKKQIEKLLGKVKTKGVSLIPLSLYFNKRGIIKIKLGVAKGKKLYDKRASLKEKDEKIQRARDIAHD